MPLSETLHESRSATSASVRRRRERSEPAPIVLVVDDDRDMRELLCLALNLEGYDTVAAADGFDALACLATRTAPALVLLDLMMPGMSGLEVLTSMKEDTSLTAIPVVVVSATPELALDGVRTLQKPVRLEVLLGVVREFCGKAAVSRPPPQPE